MVVGRLSIQFSYGKVVLCGEELDQREQIPSIAAPNLNDSPQKQATPRDESSV